MIRQISRTALRFHGLSIRRRAQTRSGRCGRVESTIGCILRILDIRGIEIAVARFQGAIVLVQIQGRADTGRSGRSAAEAPLVSRRPYFVRNGRTNSRGGRGGSARASRYVAALCLLYDTARRWQWRIVCIIEFYYDYITWDTLDLDFQFWQKKKNKKKRDRTCTLKNKRRFLRRI